MKRKLNKNSLSNLKAFFEFRSNKKNLKLKNFFLNTLNRPLYFKD